MNDVRAIQVSSPGGPEVLRPVLLPRVPLRSGEVRIRTTAIGVNFIDVYERTGAYRRAMPYVPGGEGSGTVVEVAPDVGDLSVGQRVAWQGVPGSYSSEVVSPAHQAIPVPDDLDDVSAAAFPLQGLTAHYLATTSYPARPGDTALVHAGAGGVGLLLTQVLKLHGASVVTTVSTKDKAGLSRAAGADVVAGYDDFEDVVARATDARGASVVYDSVGLSTFEGSLRSLRRRGTLVLFGQSSGSVPPFPLERLGRLGSLTVTRPTLRDFVATPAELRERADELLAWVTSGRVRLRVAHSFDLSAAAGAHEALESRRTTGKIVLLP